MLLRAMPFLELAQQSRKFPEIKVLNLWPKLYEAWLREQDKKEEGALLLLKSI